jgi:hypothetical protein
MRRFSLRICGLVVTSRTRTSAIRTSTLGIIVDADADAILAMLLSFCRYLFAFVLEMRTTRPAKCTQSVAPFFVANSGFFELARLPRTSFRGVGKR